MTSTPIEQFQELLEDFVAIGEEIWNEAEAHADAMIHGSVRDGKTSLQELAHLSQNREQLTRYLVLQKTLDFLVEQGLPQEEIDRAMTANGNGFSEAALLNMDNGILPEREAIEAFRVRAMCLHFAFVCDVSTMEGLRE